MPLGSYLRDLDRVRAFRRVCDFERDSVTFLERVECAVALIRVEEEILLLAFDLDEAKSLIGDLGDSSCLHSNGIGWLNQDSLLEL